MSHAPSSPSAPPTSIDPADDQPIPVNEQPQPTAGYPLLGAVQHGADDIPTPASVFAYPRELEYLNRIDELLIHQKLEYDYACLTWESKNKYTVKNARGQKLYAATEDTNCCTRNFWGSCRPFDLEIKDIYGIKVIHLARDLRCTLCCFPCCLQRLEVSFPHNQLIGVVIQEWSFFTSQFRIENEKGEEMFKIKGPCCTYSICGDVNFKILSTDGNELGKISKHWGGCCKEAYTDADNFSMTFPLGLDVKMKVILLGALFLIDYMYYEKRGDEISDIPSIL